MWDLIIRGSNDGSKGSHTEAAALLLRVSCYRLNSSFSQDNVTNKTRSPAHPVPELGRYGHWLLTNDGDRSVSRGGNRPYDRGLPWAFLTQEAFWETVVELRENYCVDTEQESSLLGTLTLVSTHISLFVLTGSELHKNVYVFTQLCTVRL